jgi:transcriptional regulator with XRE-family HTH domain
MTDGPPPALHRRRLRTELREARQETDLTQQEVASAMDWSLSKVIRIESGAVSITTNDLKALLQFYNIVDQRRIEELITLARAARRSSWLSRYRESLPPRFFQYVEYENSASIIRTFEPMAVPGLLQTRQYATDIMQKFGLNESPDALNNRIEVRMKRQELLEQSGPPQYFALLDEAVIRRLMGEPSLLKEQIKKLINLAQRPNMTIEIVPFSAGIHAGLVQTFVILEFSHPEDNDLLYLESASREVVLSREEAGDISEHREVFEQLRALSFGPEGSLDYMRKVDEGT